jgi:hypothetical protein
LRELRERPISDRHETVARVAALERSRDREAGGQRRRHVLHRVHGDVGRAGVERLLELLDEEALPAGSREAPVLDAVALGHDRDEAHHEARMQGDEAGGDVLGLPQGEPAPSRRNAKLRGHPAILPRGVEGLGCIPGTGTGGCP